MKLHHLTLFLLTALLIFSCSNNSSQQEFDRLEQWEEIRTAAKADNIDYLLNISADTLECIECNEGESWVVKEGFFAHYLEQIETSDDKPYNFHSEAYEDESGFNTRYRITYSYGGGGSGEPHSSIYTLLTGEKGIQFQGVIGIP